MTAVQAVHFVANLPEGSTILITREAKEAYRITLVDAQGRHTDSRGESYTKALANLKEAMA